MGTQCFLPESKSVLFVADMKRMLKLAEADNDLRLVAKKMALAADANFKFAMKKSVAADAAVDEAKAKWKAANNVLHFRHKAIVQAGKESKQLVAAKVDVIASSAKFFVAMKMALVADAKFVVATKKNVDAKAKWKLTKWAALQKPIVKTDMNDKRLAHVKVPRFID